MNIFDELAKNYFEFDNNIALLEQRARAKGFVRKEKEYRRKRDLNDQAYFLFMFTKLEDRVTESYKSLLNSRSSNISNYENWRAWNIFKEGKGLSFMEKISLLVVYNGADYHKFLKYKKQRDTIAHGGVVSGINISVVLSDFKYLHSKIK